MNPGHASAFMQRTVDDELHVVLLGTDEPAVLEFDRATAGQAKLALMFALGALQGFIESDSPGKADHLPPALEG